MITPAKVNNDLIICKPDIPEDPETLRWRAWWDGTFDAATQIEMKAYPIVGRTRCGVWIDPEAYYTPSSWVMGLKKNRRWVSNNAASSWAKPTHAEALTSLFVRLDRWSSRLCGDIIKVLNAADLVVKVSPDHKWLHDRVKGSIKAVAEGKEPDPLLFWD